MTKDQREVSTLSSWGQDTAAAPIRSSTERLLLSPSSFTRRLIGFSCESLSLVGRRWAYHVSPLSPCGLGRVSGPVARRLRFRQGRTPFQGLEIPSQEGGDFPRYAFRLFLRTVVMNDQRLIPGEQH